MGIVPKKLNFRLRFRNKTKTRKILNRHFRLQRLLKKGFNNPSCFLNREITLVEEKKDLSKNPFRASFLNVKSNTYCSTLESSQKCLSINSLSNNKKMLNSVLKPSNIFLEKKKTFLNRPQANKLLFGRYGICFKQYSIISSTCAETFKLDIAKSLKKKGRFWIRICCDTPISARPAETRMGKGKGSLNSWAAKVNPGQLFFEFSGINHVQLKEIYQKLCKKSGVRLSIVY